MSASISDGNGCEKYVDKSMCIRHGFVEMHFDIMRILHLGRHTLHRTGGGASPAHQQVLFFVFGLVVDESDALPVKVRASRCGHGCLLLDFARH